MPEPIGSIQETSGSAGFRELASFLQGLLLGEAPPPLLQPPQESPWKAAPGPEILRQVDAPGWQELENRFRSCELLARAEVSREPDIPRLLTETLARFQLRRTVIDYNDDCPPPWGITACQALVAAGQIGWLVGARQQDRESALQANVRAEVTRWLGAPELAGESRTGDLLVFHLLGEGLRRWQSALDDRVKAARHRLSTAEGDREIARRLRKETLAFTAEGRQARADFRSARAREREAEEEIRRTEAARQVLGEITAEWEAADPLPAEGAAPSPGGDRKVWPVAPLLADPRAAGAQLWLTRRLVSLASLTPAAPDGGLGRTAVFLRQAGRALEQASGDDRWWIRRFLARFYRLWVDSCPSPETVRSLFGRVRDEQRAVAGNFFAPWGNLLHDLDLSSEPEWAQGEAERACRQEHRRVDGEPAAKLQEIADFLRNIRGRIAGSGELRLE